ncbi:gliding motility-associated C-terminal domain-containing protein [Carboxylicivirga sp. M1479]|uniref:T9SS type B sorting domain-containing protein n=1 Tax=Carboxylicivirga sp. M1479 TaxID=2594476 RepID=UPI0011787356|nr:gliding motility-associated C-terminal domain-containing protein [Carboxylicivirga sp. M1479]TRX72174.1 T9SS type B sorting domain-containing protein [Carboxylicivirga sp. M1479]
MLWSINRILLFISLFILSATLTKGQITSNAFYSESTAYGGGFTEDPIFFYTDINTATLTAPTGINFQWYQYSSANMAFEPIAGATQNTLTNLVENGFRVDVDGVPHYCWNFVPIPMVNNIDNEFESCNNIRLTASNDNKALNYYNHRNTHEIISVDYGYTWTSSPQGDVEGLTDISVFIDAPTEDTEYTVISGSKFAAGIPAAEADYSYTAIAVKAAFSFETEGTADNEATEGSAPMIVRFTDESLGNVTDWEWTFGDAGKDFVPDPIFTFQKYNEDGYPVVLKVKNLTSECEDETAPEVFTVNEMVIKVPNAFTPFSSPGQNDEFRVSYRSVNKFTMMIYNRWGRKVYQGSNPETGWNGRIGNQKAEPGVYFYKIEAEGFKGEKEELEGAVHLIVN